MTIEEAAKIVYPLRKPEEGQPLAQPACSALPATAKPTDEELKRWREKWGEGSTIHELSEIINTARDRGLQIHGSEIKWLLELPMTEDEYQRFCALTGWWGRVKL